ncbi:MAG: ABC transporter permease [Succinivibrio sp.]|nr:ABC transporter permease [Succinivibrio sp.]
MKAKFTIFMFNYGILLLLIGILTGLCFVLVPSVFSLNNITVMLQQAVVLGLFVYGLSFVVTSGGLDLSLYGIAGLCTVILPLCMTMGQPLTVAIAFTLAVALVCGLFNGLLIALFSAPSYLITLGTLFLFRGVAELLCNGKTLSVENVWLQVFGRGSMSVFPYAIFVLLGVMVFALFVFNLTAFGRYAIGVGSNPEAARLSGVMVRTVKVTCFSLSALCAGSAGIILDAYTVKSQANYNMGFELETLIALLLGGLSLKGGQARVLSLFFSILFIVLFASLLNKLYVGAAVKQVSFGLLFILALAYNLYANKVQDNQLRASGS